MHVSVKRKLHIHTECGLRFHPLLRTSYMRDYWSAPLSEDVFSGCYVQWGGGGPPWIVSCLIKVWPLQLHCGPNSSLTIIDLY